ncbi:oligosaccharyl transferase subunit ost3/OST6 [Mycoemilia scoparia]|uniref:Oligosaccharyl transferase subunit ost3/OST6 n=1 Tax=Mycoemilia scoparia TaxID=417184 RepID=A0A9W7ZRV3_9FUNG|nr:oligosaccharyl transferase subunit ost3/OST6 [Mycoemilia scoparia]
MVDEPIRSISRYWKKNGQDDRLYFATIDAGTSSDIFEKLQLDNVPRLIAFPADIGQFKGSHKYPREINIVALKFDADAMAEQLSEELGVKLGTDVPFDYTKPLMYLGIVVVGGYVVYQLYQNLMRGGLIKSIAGVLSIVFILMMSSGYMWGKINQAPYIGASRGGEPSLFSPGNQIQFGIETQIVSALYALCAISVVGLTVHVPKIQNQERRTFMIFVWLIVLISTYSYLNVVFRIKIPSYPYRLLLP